MARSGSMWTYNVTRDLLLSAGHVVIPKELPIQDIHITAEAFRSSPADNVSYCMKSIQLLVIGYTNMAIVFRNLNTSAFE